MLSTKENTVGLPAILSIAGSDPSGGAGIQADIKTFTALGCYGTSVVTALTAQNTTGVQAVHAPPPEFVEQQICAVLDDIEVFAIKTGMLFDAANTHAVARALKAQYSDASMPPLVCDPVCVSTSGHILLDRDAIEVMINELFSLATLITPNKSEAELLLSFRNLPHNLVSLEDIVAAANDLLSLGPGAVLLKGGHLPVTGQDVERLISIRSDIRVVRDGLPGDNMEILQIIDRPFSLQQIVVDVLCQSNNEVTLFLRPRIDSTSTHGTGCTLSAALACALGRGMDLTVATSLATAYTHIGIETAFPIGHGHGPLNHMHSICQRNIPQRTLSNPFPFTYLLIRSTAKVWKEYVEHDFVKLLGKGSLPRECFIHFIKQDYRYLKYYARAYGLLAAKSPSYPSIQSSAQVILHIVHESSMHKSFCTKWGITEEELESAPESAATTAYGAYLIDVGLHGDSMKLDMALLACLLGYGEVGLWLKRQASRPESWVKLEGNPYLQWIDDYSGEYFQAAVKKGIETIESRAAADPPSPARFEEWCGVWERCTRLETNFWDMAMDLL